MLPDRVSNPGPMALESDALQIGLRSPAQDLRDRHNGTMYQRGKWN